MDPSERMQIAQSLEEFGQGLCDHKLLFQPVQACLDGTIDAVRGTTSVAPGIDNGQTPWYEQEGRFEKSDEEMPRSCDGPIGYHV
jgi:hypothetical protein